MGATGTPPCPPAADTATAASAAAAAATAAANDDDTRRTRRFLAWAAHRGICLAGAEVAEGLVPGGRGLVATADLPKGHTLFRVPRYGQLGRLGGGEAEKGGGGRGGLCAAP